MVLSDSSRGVVHVALIGNPNTGKSTLFGALVGAQQRVGNYPGVTVEKKTGRFATERREYHVVDLPGLYSLAPRSRDEMVAVDLLLGRMAELPRIDAVVCIMDASNLRRNLYLVGQTLELGLPTILVLNKLDLAERHEVSIDVERLRRRLPAPLVATQANRGRGIGELKAALDDLSIEAAREIESVFPEAFEAEVSSLLPLVEEFCRCRESRISAWWLARRLLLDSSGYLKEAILGGGLGWRGHCGRHQRGGHGGGCGACGNAGFRGGRNAGHRHARAEELLDRLDAARVRLAEADCPSPEIETKVRYAWADRMLDGVVDAPATHPATPSDRIDRVLTHRFFGAVVFAAVMFVMFQAVFAWAVPLMDGIAAAMGWVESRLVESLSGTSWGGGAVESLLVRGVLGGVGGVLMFLPQIVILFFCIALLEQCGYMARAAYLMDRLMARAGLSGQAFIPLLCCFACAVPGIMATRVIGDRRSRMTTILVAPLMTCSARLIIYTLLIAAFVPARSWFGGLVSLRGLVLMSFYLLGIMTAVVVALALKWSMLRGGPAALLMEMPAYEWPSPRAVALRVVERAWLFVRTAGTVILLVSIVVWAALYYPRPAEVAAPFAARRAALETSLAGMSADNPKRTAVEGELTGLTRKIDAAYQRQSFLARVGRAIEPVVRPLGWDWRIGAAVLASFPQREAVIATLGVIFSDDSPVTDDAATDVSLANRLQRATWEGSDRPLFTLPVALSIMVFYALCAQCVATLAVIRRETGSWRWPAFSFGYLTALAYVGALITYQLGSWLAG